MEQIAGFLNISIKTGYNWLSKFMLKGIYTQFLLSDNSPNFKKRGQCGHPFGNPMPVKD